MQIIKSSGELQKFSSRKIYRTVLEAGGSKKLAKESIDLVKKNYHKNLKTKEILDLLLDYLKKEPGVSERYDLKRAIMSLGPSGFPFEDFFASVLKYYGFKTKTGSRIKGKEIYHEVDIVAEREKKFMIECKYHNESGNMTKLKPAMYTYARFLDVKKNGFDSSWLVTNTKCSLDAIKYSLSVGQKVTSWKYPESKSLQRMIEKFQLYPITILKNLSSDVKNKLYQAKIVVAKDLLNYSIEELRRKTRLSVKEIEKIIQETKEVCDEL